MATLLVGCRFVLHQQGGWWCWDEYSCKVRWDHFANHTTEKRTLMSTVALAALTQQYDTFNGEKNTGIMTHNASVRPPRAPITTTHTQNNEQTRRDTPWIVMNRRVRKWRPAVDYAHHRSQNPKFMPSRCRNSAPICSI